MEPGDYAVLALASEKLKQCPALIHKPELRFFREYLLKFGVRLPADGANKSGENSATATQIDLSDSDDGAKGRNQVATRRPPAAAEGGGDEKPADKARASPAKVQVEGGVVADSDEESGGLLPEDLPPFPELPPPRIEDELEEAMVQACAAAKEASAAALEEGDTEKALGKLTEALLTGAASALVFARRGELLLQEGRPCAAMVDCSAALEVNPDCGKAYRIRGMAARKLGRWEAALQDLAVGQKLDYDESVEKVHRFVAEKARAAAAKNAKRRRTR